MKVQNDDLKELMALLPSSIRTTKEFTTKTKMVIAQLILMNGLDKVKNDGYFFVTNQKLVEELGITEKTIIKILRNLEEHNFISRKVGKRGEASEYIVNEDVIKSFGNTVKIHCKKENKITVSNYSNNLENTVINYSNKINDLMLIINNLTKSNQELINKVNNLEITVLNYSNKIENYSTDTDTDTESELDIEKESYLNNIKNILEKIYNKKLINNSTEINEEKSEEVEVIETSTSDNNKKENNNLNIEEVGLLEDPTSINKKEDTEYIPMGNGTDDEDEVLDMMFGKEEKIEKNNTAFQPTEVGMQIIEEKSPSMKEKFEKNLTDCINRLGDNANTVSQLNEKLIKLCAWVEKHNESYTPNEYEIIKERIFEKYTECKDKLEVATNPTSSDITEENESTNIFPSIFVDETKPKVKKEETITIKSKETIEKELEEFQSSLQTYENLEDAKHQLKQYINSKDKQIREFELVPMVTDIIKEIDTQIEANKAFLTTFNLQDKESITDDERTLEIALKQAKTNVSFTSHKVEDEYPF